MAYKDIIEDNKKLILMFNKITQAYIELDTTTNNIKNTKLEETDKGGILEVTDTYVKVFDVFRQTHMRELFFGEVNDIQYSNHGAILKIIGISKSWFDGSLVDFTITHNIISIDSIQIQDDNHYYVDIEASKAMPSFKNNFLLTSFKLYASGEL